MGTGDADVPEIARRIRAAVPDVRLIALLRDPVKRALSHHRMATLRGQEHRTFDDAARASVVPEALDEARRAPTETTSYVVQGEYARILGAYLAVFPRERLHVALTADLAEDPLATMRAIFAFLGVEPSAGAVRASAKPARRAATSRLPGHGG
ncbi:MAG: sulfotransferase [Solirubrobacteraceae bacterium MAG38_C4-C5]|nr:sulfotransferase [Candidatus Siliceabacter maunaloa]